MINSHIFRAYDIRGIAVAEGEQQADLTPQTAHLIGKGTATYLIRKYGIKNMAVGMDNRHSGPALKSAFIQGVLETGMNVTDIGLSVSPMIYFASCEMGFESATNITASHNPKEYNGFKTVTKGAHSICGEELQSVLKIILESDFIDSQALGTLNNQDIWPKYKEILLGKVSLDDSQNGKVQKPLKVVVDAGNGTAGKFAPELLRLAGCEVIELYCELDGDFPNHEANPEELKNMQDLILAVKANSADIGLGFDGDGDRVGVVNELGEMYSADYILLLLARDLVKRVKEPKIVFDVKVSQVVINDLKRLGAIPVMSKTGHSFIESKMKELASPLGGEVSGHLFFGENYYGFDDALLGALKIIKIVAESGSPLSSLLSDLPKVYTTPEFKASCPDNLKFQVVKELVDYFTANYDCITIDGVRVNFDETSWGAVRASNTSPNLTLRFESTSPQRLAEIQKVMYEQILRFPSVSTDWYKSV